MQTDLPSKKSLSSTMNVTSKDLVLCPTRSKAISRKSENDVSIRQVGVCRDFAFVRRFKARGLRSKAKMRI
jgi:hypothetical protein